MHETEATMMTSRREMRAAVAANRIRDLDINKIEWRKFKDINFVNIDYKPFDASEWPAVESGLAGPVRLLLHD